ncbi:MAG TPA: ANTAR domain-containing protein, partial [Mycobacteriales bacterium]|nr:ANTAR domain-containing protein [Mycobacteriales bacterium]
FGPKDHELAAVFATEASSILTDAGVDVTDDGLAGRLSEALRARTIIAQAQGVLMERDGISEGDAFEALRSFSQHSSQPLRERAEAILTSTRPGAGSAAGGDPDD